MLRGLVEGCLAAVCLLYAMQTRVMYPEWMLHTLDHPWIILMATIAAISIWNWSPIASALLLLCILAFIADVYIFSRKPFYDNHTTSPMKTEIMLEDSWVMANGDTLHKDEETFASTNGPPLANINLQEPMYPTFHGLDESPTGLAPFS